MDVIQASFQGWGEIFSNMFCIRGEGSVYFNIRGEESVIQTSFKGEECNLLIYL